jgi:hypothetical protein
MRAFTVWVKLDRSAYSATITKLLDALRYKMFRAVHVDRQFVPAIRIYLKCLHEDRITHEVP